MAGSQTEGKVVLHIRSSISIFFLSLFRILAVTHDSGGKDKPTIVLLHGIAATSNTWRFVVKELDESKYRVITLDLLGFGKSPKPNGCRYSVDDHSIYVNRTLKKLEVHKPFILVGHSMGSIISTHYANKYPKEVSSLFLLSLPLYTKSSDINSTFLAGKQTDAFIKIYESLSKNKKFAIKYSKKIRKLLNLHDGMDVTEGTWNSFRLSLKNTIIQQDTYDEIKNIKVPINIMYGLLDGFLVQKNVDKLSEFKNVEITKILTSHHSIDERFAKTVAQQVNSI